MFFLSSWTRQPHFGQLVGIDKKARNGFYIIGYDVSKVILHVWKDSFPEGVVHWPEAEVFQQWYYCIVQLDNGRSINRFYSTDYATLSMHNSCLPCKIKIKQRIHNIIIHNSCLPCKIKQRIHNIIIHNSCLPCKIKIKQRIHNIIIHNSCLPCKIKQRIHNIIIHNR